MESPTFLSLSPNRFTIPSELIKTLNKKVKPKRVRKRRKQLTPNPTVTLSHPLSDFVEDKDFLKWSRDQLPLTQKILNAKYVEKLNFERELSPAMSYHKFKSHSILFTFQEKFAKEVLSSREYYKTFDGFEPIDNCHDTFLTYNINDETTLETIDLNSYKPETSSGTTNL